MITVRRVLPHEFGKYKKHLLALDAKSKYLRFGHAISDTMIEQVCSKIEKTLHKHVLFCIENNELEFIAVGHISTDGEMELAFSVLPEHQGKGFGNALMHRCIQHCRTKGWLTGFMVYVSTNSAIKHLCSKYGISTTTEYGESYAAINLEKAGIATILDEVTDNSFAALEHMRKVVSLPWHSLEKALLP